MLNLVSTNNDNANEYVESDDEELSDLPSRFQPTKYIVEEETKDFFSFEEGNGLNMIHLNCRSLNKNFNNLLSLFNVISGKLSIIALTETWMSALLEKDIDNTKNRKENTVITLYQIRVLTKPVEVFFFVVNNDLSLLYVMIYFV